MLVAACNVRVPRLATLIKFMLGVLVWGGSAGSAGLMLEKALAEEVPRLVLSVTDRLASLRQTTVPPDIVSEYPLPSELLWEYQRAPNPRKSYVRYWTTPSGLNILRDAPADHLHHHGLMFAIGVDDVDFWAEDSRSGHQREVGKFHSGTKAHSRDGQNVRMAWVTQQVEWRNSELSEVLLVENRQVMWAEIGPREGRPAVRLVLWKSELSLPPEKETARLWGRPYFGLGMRFIEAMDRTGQFFNAAGAEGVKETNGSRAPWCAYRVHVGDRPVTVAMMDHPDNPRHPATWFTMVEPFAYLSATLGLHTEPISLRSGEKLNLTYGVAAWDGSIAAEEINSLYRGEFPRLCDEIRGNP